VFASLSIEEGAALGESEKVSLLAFFTLGALLGKKLGTSLGIELGDPEGSSLS